MTFPQTCALLAGVLIGAPACGQATEEYKVKAAFLYNFPKFIEWPSHAFKSPSDPIVIGVLGKNMFVEIVASTVAGKTVDGHPFQVRAIEEPEQAAGCQILFIAASDRKRIAALLHDLGSAGMLTVGETDSFAEMGGVVNFKIEQGTVRLQINVEAAHRQHLHISAKLLGLAEIVGK